MRSTSADGNLVQVRSRLLDEGVRRADAQSPAVHQHQRAVRAESAQVGGGDAARGSQAGRAIAEVLPQVVGKVLRQLADDVGDVGLAGNLHVLVRDHLDGAGARGIGTRDARARDDHLVHVVFRRRGGGGGWLRAGQCRCRTEKRRTKHAS